MKLLNGIRLVVCLFPLEELALELCPLTDVLQSGKLSKVVVVEHVVMI
jgi:hypothetical protein